MIIRFREGYKKHLQRRIKERRFRKTIKHEYHYIKRINGDFPACTFNGYVVDDSGIIRQVNKYSKRYWFKNPRYYRRVRRRYFNKDVGDVDMTSFGRNYKKVSRKS
ncbi:MAG: hypothetical protein K2K02_06030 [Ruminococcus sp.]|nr:hypothetical protein [Ruminococcus sp.]MDE6678582.1 hypothetical protein [Ruminococcus sp.]